jgi:hypothetical protein
MKVHRSNRVPPKGRKSDRDKIAARARVMVTDPLVAAEWRAAWNRVLARLQTSYAARRPVLKQFEAHHYNEVAREAMLRALVDGKTIDEAEALALQSVAPNKS